MKKMLIIGFGLVIGLSILALGSWYINYYVYSWKHHILPCDEKEPTLLNFNRPYGEDLGEKLDLTAILDQVRKNPSYRIMRGETNYLVLERLFDGKSYVITLNHEKSTTMFYIRGGHRPNTIPCSTPDYKILMNTYQMIDDLPLTDAQKQKLKDLTTVRGGYTPHWG